jgi:Cation transport ATPase
MSYFAGMAEAKKSGIVFKDACAVEKSSLMKSVVFNKVGTLTGKNYTVTDIKTDKMDTATFLKVAAYAESKSKSSVARAIVAAYGSEISEELIRDYVEYPGKGVSVNVDGIRIILGNGDFINENGVLIPEEAYEGSSVHMSVNGIYAGRISLNEIISPDTSEILKKLYAAGIERIAMVSGDGRMRDRAVSTALGINEYYAECSTKEKVLRIEGMKDRTDFRGTVAFVGNNDCAKQLFSAADIGISINSIACRSELPKADVMIMSNSIKPITSVMGAGKKTNRFILLGMLTELIIKLAIMVLAAFGIAPLWFGLLIDLCASFIVLLCCSGKAPLFGKLRLTADND